MSQHPIYIFFGIINKTLKALFKTHLFSLLNREFLTIIGRAKLQEAFIILDSYKEDEVKVSNIFDLLFFQKNG